MTKIHYPVLAALLASIVVPASVAENKASNRSDTRDLQVEAHAIKQIRDGRKAFRYATFGDEAFWGDALRLHEAIAGTANGGVGPGVSPRTALSVGLKVDAAALPNRVLRALRAGDLNLDDP